MSRVSNLASERGAVLIQTSIAAFVLIGMGTFVVDYGVLWVARHQAQNAADAGAMAGAMARAYEDFFDNPADSNGATALSASGVVSANPVWGAPATAVLPPLDTACPPEVGAGHCVKVEVYRNGTNGSTTLPTWFGPLLGIGSQGVRATASARVVIPHATKCLRPWAIPDSWIDHSVPANTDFTKYDGAGVPLANADEYLAPSAGGPGTGLRFATTNAALGDFGSPISLTLADLTNPANPILRTSIVPLELAGGYAASLSACNGQTITVGDRISISATAIQNSDFNLLRDRDPGAFWNPGIRAISNSCDPVCAPFSPRLVAAAVFDVDDFQYRRSTGDWSACVGGNPCVSIVNIVGLFIVDAIGTVRLTTYPGMIPTDAPRLSAESSFLKSVTLVR